METDNRNLRDENPVLIDKIRIRGYKSIKDETVEFQNVNVLIGCNGAGKSNLLSVVGLIESIRDKRLRVYVAQKDVNALLYGGAKGAKSIGLDVYATEGVYYSCELLATEAGRLCFNKEMFGYDFLHGEERHTSVAWDCGSGHFESNWDNYDVETYAEIADVVQNLKLDNFHVADATPEARIKQGCNLVDDIYLRGDAENLAPYLYALKQINKKAYDYYIETIKLVAPFFEDFVLEPEAGSEKVGLKWKHVGVNGIMNINQLSDGTLRFAALSALLLQDEKKQPSIIVIDEPELGLHPFAISILCGLIKKVAFRKQVIIATQNKDVIDEFELEDILVVDRDKDGSHFRRLQREQLKEWLADYSISELWDTNLLGGRISG